MKAQVVFWLPFLLSAITVWMTLLAGNMHRSAWLVGLCNQALWLVWIVAAGAWGLLPLNAVLWIVYARNHFKWAAHGIGTPPSPTQGVDHG
jgi:hypothetical protein